MYACTNIYIYAHTYPYMLIMINMAASMVVAICNFLTCSFWYYMYCMCMCAYVHTCMCACRKTLLCPQIIPYPPALPPWSWRSPNCKNSIKHEQIEIIEFCLKIYDPWTLLHIYRLGLMCRQGGVPSQMALLYFGPKKYIFLLLWPSDKKIPVFALNPIRPYLDWVLRGFLTS